MGVVRSVVHGLVMWGMVAGSVRVCDAADGAVPSAESMAFYEAKVRPLLAQHCGKCHLDGKAKGGLSLDGRKALLQGGESGPAVSLEKPADSLLLQAVNYDGFEMPPSGKLPAESIAILTRWVEIGLPMPEGAAPAASTHGVPQVNETTRNHWSFRLIQKPVVPAVGTPSWVVNPIDAFVLKQLETHGLTPNPAAAPRELYRRVHYDLIGLPPHPDDVTQFESAPSAEAYRELVESLLTSPQHGEHWARYWLDLVRYAETNSYERDNPKPHVWRYRDYVIRSIHENKPYDQFLKEQIAGDELEHVTPDSLIATGYYRLGLWDDEPVDREMAYFDGLDDIVGTTAQAFLGLTLNCARCHDHKLDPVPQADYYRFLAFFRNVQHFDNGGGASLLDITPQIAAPASTTPLVPTSEQDGQTWSYTTETPAEGWSQIRFDASDWKTGLGGFGSPGTPGSVVRTEWKTADIWLRRTFQAPAAFSPESRLAVRLHHDEDAEIYLNGTRVLEQKRYTTGYSVLPLELPRQMLVNGENVLAVHCKQTGGGQYIDVGLLEGNSSPEQLAMEAEQVAFRARLEELDKQIEAFEESMKPHLKGGEIDDFKAESVRERVLKPHVGQFLTQKQFKDYVQLRQQRKQLRDNPPRSQGMALVVKEHGKDAPPTHILIRGNARAQGDAVQPGFPAVLTSTTPEIRVPDHGASTGRRRALAEWMVSPENPLTARVIVNRIWQWHFGRGIVASSSNFGLQGDAPTHPELLNWLAAELIEHHWDLRHIHRLILSSNTYRMSSRGQEQALTADPLNAWFWRFDMRRLRAEEIRDTILATNGTLNIDKMYGPSIYPTIEAEVLAGQSRPGAGWENSSPEDKARRSIYIHIKRSLTVPLLAAFDVADSDSVCPVRFATTQPTQALSMLNSVFLNEQAELLAQKTRHSVGSDPKVFVAAVLRQALQRMPTEAEIVRGVMLIADLKSQHQMSDEAAQKYYCLMVLNLNEFVYLD
ncbi:MAG: DUF1553 domain-containing protein [Planctomycetota bacterium]|nr:MAG: DUF1553 domain-containing protein [Planctomycetota bacterium]